MNYEKFKNINYINEERPDIKKYTRQGKNF